MLESPVRNQAQLRARTSRLRCRIFRRHYIDISRYIQSSRVGFCRGSILHLDATDAVPSFWYRCKSVLQGAAGFFMAGLTYVVLDRWSRDSVTADYRTGLIVDDMTVAIMSRQHLLGLVFQRFPVAKFTGGEETHGNTPLHETPCVPPTAAPKRAIIHRKQCPRQVRCRISDGFYCGVVTKRNSRIQATPKPDSGVSDFHKLSRARPHAAIPASQPARV